jgi:hypothetical protein
VQQSLPVETDLTWYYSYHDSHAAMTIDPGSVPKAAIPTLDDDFENDTEAVDRLVKLVRISSS